MTPMNPSPASPLDDRAKWTGLVANEPAITAMETDPAGDAIRDVLRRFTHQDGPIRRVVIVTAMHLLATKEPNGYLCMIQTSRDDGAVHVFAAVFVRRGDPSKVYLHRNVHRVSFLSGQDHELTPDAAVEQLTAWADEDITRIPALASRAGRAARTACTCIHTCADDPASACDLSGEWHVHPGEPCPQHPDAPGDR